MARALRIQRLGVWYQLTVPFAPGANTITAVAEDINGNAGLTSISVLASGALVDPVSLTAIPAQGFSPLSLTFQATANVPGTVQAIKYDYIGDYKVFEAKTDFSPVPHVYNEAGNYFPVVTVLTTSGNFSSQGGFNLGGIPSPALQIIVSPPPAVSSLTIEDPVDIKAANNGDFYVLSRSTATVRMYDAGQNILRSKDMLGVSPMGLDIDSAGNVYVALAGSHQVYKLMPQGTTFVPAEFSYFHGSKLGNAAGTGGSGPAEFNAPSDVAVSPDGSLICVSDTGNHRISTFDGTGRFLSSVGSMGQAWNQFLSPKGITWDGASLFLADSGHHQIATILDGNVHERFGSAGSALGQFQNPANIHYGVDALLVTDTGNNRVQRFDKRTFQPRYELSTLLQIQLNQPLSASIREAANSDFVYIADTGNNRVLVCAMPKVTPLPVWTSARSKLMAQDIEGALAEFASTSVESYRAEFTAIGGAALAQHMGEITQISPIYIRGDQALYWFVNVIDDTEFTFYVTFVLENGRWKIRSF